MEALLWFVVFFVCGLINTYIFFFFSSKNKRSWLSSLTSLAFKPKTVRKPIEKNQISPGINRDLDLETLFSTFDRDGDGYITSGEVVELFMRLGLFTNIQEALSEIHKVDTNSDGLIDLEEFSKLYNSLHTDNHGDKHDYSSQKDVDGDEVEDEEREQEERELKGAFDIFDKNGDGTISAEELREILTSLGLKKGERMEDCVEMIKKVDMDGDGMVNFEEFKNMMAFKGRTNALLIE